MANTSDYEERQLATVQIIDHIAKISRGMLPKYTGNLDGMDGGKIRERVAPLLAAINTNHMYALAEAGGAQKIWQLIRSSDDLTTLVMDTTREWMLSIPCSLTGQVWSNTLNELSMRLTWMNRCNHTDALVSKYSIGSVALYELLKDDPWLITIILAR